MKITYNVSQLLENVSSQVAQMCRVVDGKPNSGYSVLLLESDNHSWALTELLFAVNRMANVLEPILSSYSFYDDSLAEVDGVDAATFTFVIEVKHPFQLSMLPSLVESYFVGYVTERWMSQLGMVYEAKCDGIEQTIKSIMLKSSVRPTGRYRLF